MKKITFIIVFLCFSCASKYDGIYVESIPSALLEHKNRYDLDNRVYMLDKEVLFSFSMYKNQLPIPSEIEHIKMTILGTTEPFSRFDSDYSQTVIEFDYLDIENKSILTEKTGLIENDKNIWLHPPRNLDAGILQLAAFPYMILNNQKKWTWKLDAAFQNYKDVHLKHSYKKMKPISYQTNFGALKCIPILAKTESYIGTTYSEFLYNDAYGFVKFEFNNIDGTSIILEMIK